jgi:ethanolamine ammonia-lyase small subunit
VGAEVLGRYLPARGHVTSQRYGTAAHGGRSPSGGTTSDMDDHERLVRAVLQALREESASAGDDATAAAADAASPRSHELPDLATDAARKVPGLAAPLDPDGLAELLNTTTARIGVGRAGPRPRTTALLRFQADHAVTQDAIHSQVSEELKDRFGLFTVRTMPADKAEYLLRPDLGRRLTDEAKALIAERCAKGPQVQLVVGDGLSADAIEHNLPAILPVIEQGLASAGITLGTTFFVEFARVGVINDVNEVVGADVVVILIGERPGLGIADAMSAYLGWRPGPGKTDAHRDLICMITDHGGVNPLEAGAYLVELIRRVLAAQASGVALAGADRDGSGGAS